MQLLQVATAERNRTRTQPSVPASSSIGFAPNLNIDTPPISLENRLIQA